MPLLNYKSALTSNIWKKTNQSFFSIWSSFPTARTNVTHDTQHKGNLCVSQTAWFIVHIDQVYFCHYLYQKNPDSASKLMFLTFFFQAALLISDKSNRFQVSNEIHRNYFMWDDFVWFAEELVRNLVSCVTFVDTWPYVLCAVPWLVFIHVTISYTISYTRAS